MTKDSHQFRDDLTDDDGAGWINRFLAEEDEFDGRSMWRLASWGVGSVGALIIAILATRSPAAINRDQLASAEIARQSQQVQWIAKESQNKARELTAALETLNGDRDRLYARVTVLEQGLDSVTGALARPAAAILPAIQQTTPAATAPALVTPAASAEADLIGPVKPAEAKAEPAAPPPKIAPVATAAPATSPAPTKSSEQKGETLPADTALTVTAAIAPSEPIASETPSASIVRKTEFGVDLGGAKSIEGLRAVWRGALKVYSQQLASLQPVIVVKERHDGLGMQLRLVAGPLSDAAEAAKLCAGFLTESNRPCETSVYEGQRLSMISEKQPEAKKPEAPVHRAKRRSKQRSEPVQEQPKTSSFSSFFGNR
ncbi:MAG: hypothetical protein Q7V17_04125 [Afipia sp.]|nr:hypothetical protein [Afipia sp.]